MTFNVLFIAHAPDAEYKIHRSVIDTGRYKLYSIVVRTQEEAVQVSKDYLQNESIDAIILCPGFTHGDVAEIFEAVEGKASVNVARGDGPSSRISAEARKNAGYFRS